MVVFAIFYASLTFADCDFIVSNYASEAVNVKVGFYGGKSALFTVKAASQNNVKIKSDLTCDSKTDAGLGVAYIDLIDRKSSGGWVYAPEAKMFRAHGVAISNNDGVKGLGPNGSSLILSHNYVPKSDAFEVRIERSDRNISRQVSSMN